ncbi:ImmA/IrrE family metallo-endopeptidase [Salinicoccus sp. Marseille-QA3877]
MRIEEKVNQIVDCCIIDTMDLNIEHLSYVFGVHILYNHEANFYVQKAGVDIVGLKFDKRREMFHAFCHESAHMFLHATNQNVMPKGFNVMQEAEAGKFALLLMMPEKLICKHELFDAQALMHHFNVTEPLALDRLELLKNHARTQMLYF